MGRLRAVLRTQRRLADRTQQLLDRRPPLNHTHPHGGSHHLACRQCRTDGVEPPNIGPKAIEGTTWLLVRAVVDGTMYDSPQPKGSSVSASYTVEFDKGRLGANDGCNSIGAPVAVQEHTVTSSGDAMSTMVGCGVSALRDAYDRELFEGSMSWTVSGGRLTLTTTNGDTFQFDPLPTGFPSDLAGVKHSTTAEKSVDGVPFRIYARPRDTLGNQCLTMEFDSPAGTAWGPISACRDRQAAKYVVNPIDFIWTRLPSGTGVLFGAVPDGSVSSIVFRPSGGGSAIGLTLTPLPDTKFQAFYGFVEHLMIGGIVTFYDPKGKPYKDTWKVPR